MKRSDEIIITIMQFKKFPLLQILLFLNLSFPISISKPITQQPMNYYCGTLRIPTHSSIFNQTLLCKSQKLYFRTSIGLFQISSIEDSKKLLTISHNSCSSTSHFVSPTHLTAGFPLPPLPNSLVFFNCSMKKLQPVIRNCSLFNGCGADSCLVFDDVGKLGLDFDPKQLNCTHYSRVYRNDQKSNDKYELGTRISFDIQDHVPNLCDECKKPNGNCGVGLRCLCHLKECSKCSYSLHPTIISIIFRLSPQLFAYYMCI
ncbi:hypothetical protein M9H77_16425 [Catharanthus roseus]|uniref:Uncharacterized protein n=1 Tax=Catharanthus roseus TaxID=4058 RepID=A0ACC0B1R1_CATRO|nr:hypothetical protein M9H77_16425 [Catharanthus roseus]